MGKIEKKKSPTELPGISRSEAMKRLRKAGIEFKTTDKPTEKIFNSSFRGGVVRDYSPHDVDMGVRQGITRYRFTSQADPADDAVHTRRMARYGLVDRPPIKKDLTVLGERLLERYPKAAMRRASNRTFDVRANVALGARRLLRKIKKRGGALGLGLTAASLGSSIKEASKK